MKILDKEIDFDIELAENVEKLQKADKQYSEKIKDSNSIIEQCNIYKEFFDNTIGEGTSQLLFEGKNNYMKIIKAYNELIDNIEQKLNDFLEESQKVKEKYERYL